MTDVRRVLADRSAESADGCRVWVRGQDWDGYGIVRIAGRSRRAHRVAYELARGPIPPGLVVRHSCDNPPCINPAHLVAGTVAENNRDREVRGRSDDRRGDRCPTAKLTWSDVAEIRDLLLTGMSQAAIGRRYAVSRKAIWKIANGNTWRTPEQYATATRRA